MYRLVTDHLGSVRAVVDAATGEVAQRIDYDEFGNVLQDTKPGFQPFGFAGGLYDPQTRLVRFGVRDYDAGIGRWTVSEPLSDNVADPNLFGYCFNDPVNLRDYNGLKPEDPWTTGLTVAGGGVGLAGSGYAVGGAAALEVTTTFGPLVGIGPAPASAVFGGGGVGIGGAGTAFAGVVGAGTLGVATGFAINWGYESAAGQSLGEDWADMQFDPGGRGRSFGEWWRCYWSPDASGCSSSCP
jgi:RHS repeat-associated protein